MVRFLSIFVLFFTLSVSAAANGVLVARELILVSDNSGSMHGPGSHYLLQRDGYAHAFKDSEVVQALLAEPTVVWVVFYSNIINPRQTIGPVYLHSEADVVVLRELILHKTPRVQAHGGTSQCVALLEAIALPRLGERRIYDLVSDEKIKSSLDHCIEAREAARYMGDKINMLGIGEATFSVHRQLFEEQLLQGFFMPAADWNDFAAAIKQKLLRELSM